MLAAAPSYAGEIPDLAALRSALASEAPPRLAWKNEALPTISVKPINGSLEVSGRCEDGRAVVVSGAGLAEPGSVECVGGRYSTRGAGVSFEPAREIVATQTLLDGGILAARYFPSTDAKRELRATPSDLAMVFASAQPGDRIVLEPGTYSDVVVRLSSERNSRGPPVIIDGRNAVTLSGASRIYLEAANTVLRGFTFREVGPHAAITIGASGTRVTESSFIACGDQRRPQAECMIVGQGGANAEIDFNSFVDSRSMSIKVRAGVDGAADQPTGVVIHHNEFRDIRRRSDNGQEPIQIAGPRGGGTADRLMTRIEHNLFYRAEGDREAISMKGPRTSVRWNVFRDMDAAPNLRGSRENTIADNIFIRTRPIRIAGSGHSVSGNIVLCPRNRSSAFVVSHGSDGYGVAMNNTVKKNVIAASRSAVAFAAQTQPAKTAAHSNRIVDNRFYLPKSGAAFKLSPETMAAEIADVNVLEEFTLNAALCQ